MAIQKTLGGDAQRGAREGLLEADRVEHQVDPGEQPRAEHAVQAGRDAARRAAGRHAFHVTAEVARQHGRKVRKPPLQLLDVRRARAFLRPEQARRSLLAEQPAIDVAGDVDRYLARALVEQAQVDARESSQSTAAARQRLASRVEQTRAQRLKMPAPPSTLALPPTPSTMRWAELAPAPPAAAARCRSCWR